MGDQRPDQYQEEIDAQGQLYRMERELLETYRDLGKRVLEMAEAEGARTNRLVDRIIEEKRRLMTLRGQRPCDGCGLYNEADSRYCRHCGHSLTPNETPPTTKQEEEPTL